LNPLVSCDTSPSAQAQRFTQVCAAAAFVIALLTAAGWLVNAPFLAGQWGKSIPMAPSTALALLFLSGGVFSYACWPAHRLTRPIGLAAAGLPALMGLLVLAQYFTGFDSGVERALSATNEVLGRFPLGRMSPLTAVSFLLESGALVLLFRTTRWRFAGAGATLLALAPTAMNTVFLVGYLYGVPLLYGSPIIPVSLPTALAFVLIGTGQIRLAVPGVAALRPWRGNTLRGVLLRSFLPAILAVIFLEGCLDTIQPAGRVVNMALWDSLTTLLAGALIVVVTAWTARRTGDVIERANEALEKNRNLLAETEKMGNVGGWEFDIDTQEQVWTEAVYHIHEVDLAYEPTVSKVLNFYTPASRPVIERALQRAIERGEPFDVELEIITAKGNLRWIHAIGKADLERRKVIGFFQDTTGRRQAEEALRASEGRYSTILRTAMDGFWLTDWQGRLLEVNEAYCRISGYSAEELLTMRVSDLEAQETASATAAHMLEVLAQGEHRFESRHRCKDGSFVELETSVQRQPNTGGHLVVFLHDITQRKRAEAERNTLQLQLARAQKVESIGRLAGGVAHDFNNLLNVIMGYSGLVLRELKRGDPATKSLMEVQRAAEKAAELTRQLLAFSREQALRPRVLDLNSVVGESEKMLRRLIREDITLVVVPDSGLGLVKADPAQIDQILINLVLNSRDAMPQGGHLIIETANVELDEAFVRLNRGAQQGSAVLLLAVRDTGLGMDQETQDRIFEPFFTTKEVGKGTGLGLSTVYGIVKQSAGYITVHSEPGQGAEFKIYLPRVFETPEPVLAGEPEPLLRGDETILVAEDEPAMRELVREFLEGAGYQVLVARDVKEAIQIAMRHKGQLDLLLTDVVMPDLSGPQLAEHLQPFRPQMKVLYMSGYTDALVASSTEGSGADLINKPFTEENLLRRLREVLEERRL